MQIIELFTISKNMVLINRTFNNLNQTNIIKSFIKQRNSPFILKDQFKKKFKKIHYTKNGQMEFV